MKIPYYQVNAFVGENLSGNPAGVCILKSWPKDELLQHIATENNLSETAFLVDEGKNIHIRWFTPSVEVDLCGHATLASAFVLFNFVKPDRNEIVFTSRSGELRVKKEGDLLSMDFPADEFQNTDLPAKFIDAFKQSPIEAYRGKTDYLLVYDSEKWIRNCEPDFELLRNMDGRGVIITAKGEKVDFVSRFFAPQSGISEDPVTGSAHTTLVPYWSEKLDKKYLLAHQVSPRGGELICANNNERIIISGRSKLYIEGFIYSI